jgi:hypothetical protein
VTGIVYCREYRVVYLNTLVYSACSQVGQSAKQGAKSLKLCSHCMSCNAACMPFLLSDVPNSSKGSQNV